MSEKEQHSTPPQIQHIIASPDCQTTLKSYFRQLQIDTLPKYRTPTKQQDYISPELKLSTMNQRQPIQQLKQQLLINSPENIIDKTKCQVLENQLRQSQTEISTLKQSIQQQNQRIQPDMSQYISLLEYNKMKYSFELQIQQKDAQIEQLKLSEQKFDQKLAEQHAHSLIQVQQCELEMYEAKYGQQQKIIQHNDISDNSSLKLELDALQKKYDQLLEKHQKSVDQLVELTNVIDKLQKDNNQLNIKNLDITKENCELKSFSASKSTSFVIPKSSSKQQLVKDDDFDEDYEEIGEKQ